MQWNQSLSFYVPLPLQILYLLFVKSVGLFLYYTYYTYISTQNDSPLFKYSFLALLIFERIASLATLIAVVKPGRNLSLLMILFSPLFSEELILFFNSKQFKYYIQQGINSQGAFNSFISSPMYVLIIIQAVTHIPSHTDTFIPGVFSLISLTLVVIFVKYITLVDGIQDTNTKNNNKINQNQVKLNHYREGIFSFIHSFSYTTLLWIGITLNTNFHLYTIALHVILGFRLINCIRRNEKKLLRLLTNSIITRCLLFQISALFQIQFDVTRLTNYVYCPPTKKFGKYAFNQISEYSFWLKAMMLFAFLTSSSSTSDLKEESNDRLEYQSFVPWILSINIISLIILAIRYYQNVISPYLFGPVLLEICSTKQLSKQFEQYTSTKHLPQSKYKRLKKLVRLDEQSLINGEDDQLVSDSLMSGFKGADIEFSSQFLRKRNKHGKVKIVFNKEFSYEYIVESIQNYGALPEISILEFKLQMGNTDALIRTLIENNSLIRIKVHPVFMQNKINILNQFVQEQIATIQTINVFNSVISPQQYFDPKQIAYDLNEDYD